MKSNDLSRRELLGRGALFGAAASLTGCASAFSPRPAFSPKPAAVDQQPIKAYSISLNTSTIRGQKLPIVKTIEIAADAGYAGIEPWQNEVEDYVKSGGKLRDLRKMLEDKGLAVTGSIAFHRWMVDDAAERKRGLEGAKRYMGQLAEIGGTHMAAPPTGNVEHVELLAAAERYRDLLEVGDEAGCIPAVEVWGFQKNLYRLGQAVMVAIEADHPKACVLPDVYHLYKGGSGLGGVKLLGANLIGGFHLNDYPDIPREKIKDGDRVHCGDGVADLKTFFRDLWSTGYRGPLSIELFSPVYWKQDAAKVAKESLAKTKAVMAAAFAQ